VVYLNDIYVTVEKQSEHVHFKGAWSSGTTYNIGDEVSNDGADFVCILGHVATTALEPIPVADEVIAGPTGLTGATGPQGEQGIKGDAGVAATNECIETPSGAMDGSNQTFALSHTPAGQIKLYYNGILLEEGADDDFSVSSTTITMHFVAPNAANGDKLIANYFY
jgi:hypothetical protein